MSKKFNSIIKKLKTKRHPFILINLNERPVFVREMYSNEHEACGGCDKKACIKVHEIDKFDHYSDWDWCGNADKCDVG